MNRIASVQIDMEPESIAILNEGATIIGVYERMGKLRIAFEENTGSDPLPRELRVLKANDEIEDNWRYIGTAAHNDSVYGAGWVAHVYEVVDK